MANTMIYLVYIFFGLAPSIIWLLYFLRKDVHPESNRMVLKIFFWGILATLPVFLIEIGISEELNRLRIPLILVSALNWFVGIAFVEEICKYLVVRGKVLKNPEFDEPVDAMLYMIIAALGFAALENILVLFPGRETLLFGEIFRQTIIISFLRLVGATFLHTLCSGIVGYFLALSFFETKKQSRLVISGLGIATILHGFFNISIIGIEKSLIIQNSALFYFSLFSIIAILFGSGSFVLFAFKKVKRLSSTCKVK